MGTPFISHLEPTPLEWERSLPPDAQPALGSLPRTFVDAMTVRSQVFVQEQNIPQANEFDADDPRSAHWVIYASVNQTVAPAVTDPATGEVLRPRQSSTQTVPIGTVRLVPFPHPPHPRDGDAYVDGVLVGNTTTGGANSPADDSSPENKQTPSPLPTFTTDRATTFHDGREPYVKLGRLAVLRDFRGRGIARQLVRAAVDWMRSHPSHFDPAPSERGLDRLGVEQLGGTVPRWRGLFCCHAQADAVRVWERCGFRVDEGMGRWTEEGIPHVGMFLRVEVEPEIGQV